jgi:hypothetical protein
MLSWTWGRNKRVGLHYIAFFKTVIGKTALAPPQALKIAGIDGPVTKFG